MQKKTSKKTTLILRQQAILFWYFCSYFLIFLTLKLIVPTILSIEHLEILSWSLVGLNFVGLFIRIVVDGKKGARLSGHKSEEMRVLESGNDFSGASNSTQLY